MYTAVICVDHIPHISGLGPGVCSLLCIFATFRRMLGVSLYLSDPGSDLNQSLRSSRGQQQQQEINGFK